jgi:hypothetical protein
MITKALIGLYEASIGKLIFWLYAYFCSIASCNISLATSAYMKHANVGNG